MWLMPLHLHGIKKPYSIQSGTKMAAMPMFGKISSKIFYRIYNCDLVTGEHFRTLFVNTIFTFQEIRLGF